MYIYACNQAGLQGILEHVRQKLVINSEYRCWHPRLWFALFKIPISTWTLCGGFQVIRHLKNRFFCKEHMHAFREIVECTVRHLSVGAKNDLAYLSSSNHRTSIWQWFLNLKSSDNNILDPQNDPNMDVSLIKKGRLYAKISIAAKNWSEKLAPIQNCFKNT